MDNRTGSDSYSLRDEPVRVTGGSTQTLLVETDVVQPTDGDRNFVRAWVDWNGDRLFDDSERILNEEIFIDDQPIEVANDFTVPRDVTGIRRMRVKANYDEGPLLDFGACQGFESGEVEDYQIEVVAPAGSVHSVSQNAMVAATSPPNMAQSTIAQEISCIGIAAVPQPPPEPGHPPARQDLEPGGDSLFMDLRSAFRFAAAGEDAIAYSATSDNEALASVLILDGQLRVTSNQAGGVGSANIVVTATFVGGRQETFSFVLTIAPRDRGFLRGWRLLLEDLLGLAE